MGLGTGAIGSLVRFGGPTGSLYAWVDGAGVYRSQDGMTWAASNTGIESLSEGVIVVYAVGSRLIVDDGPRVYTSSDGQGWQTFDKGCPPPTGGSRPVIVSDGASRYVVFGTGANGVLAHPL